MFQRNGHYSIDDGETYCYDTNSFDARVYGDTVVTGPQPDTYCDSCRTVDPEWIEVSKLEFDRAYN